ncbi:hypothetical protein AB0E08_07580 [Streptomyces sp. NPDC048281]|uniref:hypothetical protein n=1 Tax=Streptomyces sp. NPDC048281 TaxID=3154715 RepID=UPI003440F657
MTRRDTVTYAAVLVAVFGTVICAAEFQPTGVQPMPAHVVPLTTPGPAPGRDPAALERAREDARRAQHKVMDDASRAATPWLAP